MGTNYYALRGEDTVCSHCLGTGKETVHTHIGKSSGGWTFSFHAARDYDLYPNTWGSDRPEPRKIESYFEWLEYLALPGIKIINEYGEEVSLADFKDLVESKKDETHNHTLVMRNDPQYKGTRYDTECFLDAEGNSFSKGEFS